MERYSTSRSSALFAELDKATDHLRGDDLEDMLWSTASEALTGRDPEMLCAVCRLCDAKSDAPAELRFGMAMRAVERAYYDCACGAWEDGGRCWSSEERPRNVPNSRLSADIMTKACEALAIVETSSENGLCDSILRSLTM